MNKGYLLWMKFDDVGMTFAKAQAGLTSIKFHELKVVSTTCIVQVYQVIWQMLSSDFWL